MAATPTVGNEVIITPDTLAQLPRVTALSDDTFILAWQTLRQTIAGFHLDETGSSASLNFLASVSTNIKSLTPLVVQESSGAIVTDFGNTSGLGSNNPTPNNEDITVHPVGANFSPFDSLTRPEPTPVDERLVDAVPTLKGTAVAFQVPNGLGIHTRLRWIDADAFSDGGKISADVPLEVPGDTNSQENIALKPSGTDLVTAAYAEVNSATGASEILLQTLTPNGITSLPGLVSDQNSHANFPDIARLADGSFVVVYQDDHGLIISHFTAAGVEDTAARIRDSSQGLLPKVTGLKDGSFIVAWTAGVGTESDGSPNEDIFLRRFVIIPQSPGSSVNIVGDTGSLVHLAQPGDQGEISMTTLADGRVVLAYSSETGDATNVNNIVYRILDPRDPTLTGTEGNDGIVAQQTASTINALGGNDTLVGGPGNDKLDGGSGIDTAKFNGVPAAVNVDLAKGTATGQGTDTLVNIENVIGSNFDDTIAGDANRNTIDGGLGNDTLDGRDGTDTVSFQSSTAPVTVDLNKGTATGEGSDTLRGFGNVIGSDKNDTITGSNGDNVLDGRGGFDTMQGLGGNDTYVVDLSGDVAKEAPGQGTDTVLASVDYTLGAGQSIEILKTTNPDDATPINLTGNELSQAIVGNAGPNFINGRDGNDTLTGLGGADTFVFNTALNAKTNVDTITDFDPLVDKIQLDSSIFAGLAPGVLPDSAFFVGPAANTADQRIIYNQSTGSLTYDSNGNAAGGTTVFAALSHGLALHAANFTVA